MEAMSDKLRPHGWTHILHDYGWANNDAGGDVRRPLRSALPVMAALSEHRREMQHGLPHRLLFGLPRPHLGDVEAVRRASPRQRSRLRPSPDPCVRCWAASTSPPYNPRCACCLLTDGIPKLAVQDNLPILGTNFTAAGLVSHPPCRTFIPDMLAINASAQGAQEYYDSVIGQWAEQGIDFVYLDGVIQDCAPTAHCWLGEIALIANAMERLGNGAPKP